jgi:hypothetical protein
MLRRLYKNLAKYRSGMVVFSHPNPSTHSPKSERVAILDGEHFLSYFSDPVEVANRLQRSAMALVAEWRQVNGEAPPNFRRPVCHYEEVARYEWNNARNRPETSIYELCISSWGHTKNLNPRFEAPKIFLSDLKVRICRRRRRRRRIFIPPPPPPS